VIASVAPALGAAHRLATRQGDAAGGALQRLLPRRRRVRGLRLEHLVRIEGTSEAGDVEQARHRAAEAAGLVGRVDAGARS
jgi:hypothetical protein